MHPRLLLVALTILIFSAKSYSQAGTLDKTFGKTGIAKIAVPLYNGEAYAQADRVAQQKDGKFIVAVTAYPDTYLNPYFHGYIYRLRNDGTVDPSFGDNGRILIYSGRHYFEFYGMLVDSSENILISHSIKKQIAYHSGFGITRLTNNGRLDSAFADNGTLTIDKSSNIHAIKNLLVLQPDEKILTSCTYAPTDYLKASSSLLFRFKKNGSVDSSFNGTGYVLTKNRTDSYDYDDMFYTIGVQPGGKIIYGGHYIKQLNADGTQDFNFGDSGIIEGYGVFYGHDSSKLRYADVNIISGGSFMCLGNLDMVDYQGGGYTTSRVYKFTKDGQPESSLNRDGVLIIYNRQSYTEYTDPPLIGNLNVQPDEKFILSSGFGSSQAISRYVKNGKPDTTFGDHGNIDLTQYGNISVTQIILQKDLKVVALINSSEGLTPDTGFFYIFRYNNDASFSKTFPSASTQSVLPGFTTIKIAPNPVANTLTITGLLPNTKLSILSASGKQLQTAIVNSDTYNWNIQNLAAGSYFLVANRGSKGIASIKFMKL